VWGWGGALRFCVTYKHQKVPLGPLIPNLKTLTKMDWISAKVSNPKMILRCGVLRVVGLSVSFVKLGNKF
jgi:hypothetical protein